MSTTRRYGDVLRTPHVPRLLGTALVARSTVGLDGLAIVLFLKGISGSYAIAGTAAAAFASAAALAGPFVGRLIDRLGALRVLVPVAVIHAAGLLAIIVLGEAGLTWAAIAAAFVAGAAIPPVGSVMRALWPSLLEDRPELVTVAYAIDATLVEIVFVVGPLVVALAYAVSGPELALALSAALAVGGTLLFVSAGPARNYHPSSDHAAAKGVFAVLRSPGLQTLVITTFPIGICLGASEVSFPAFGESVGNRGYAGILLAIWSLGSAAGGFAYGARPHTRPLPSIYVGILSVLPLVTLPLAAASSLAVMVPLAFLAGVTIAPTFAAGNELVGHVAPPGALTEAYTWPLTTMVAGVAIGNAVAGGIIELSGWRASFATAAAVGALGAVVAWTRRDTLGSAP